MSSPSSYHAVAKVMSISLVKPPPVSRARIIERNRRPGEGVTPAIGFNGGADGGEINIVVGIMAIEGFDTATQPIVVHVVLEYSLRRVAAGVALRGLTDFTLGYGIEALE